jgi:anti-sigma factor RsiW
MIEETHAERDLLRDHAAGRLDERRRAEVTAHLERCASCRHVAAVEAELSGALDRLPARAAPPALRNRLEALVNPASSPAAAEVPRGIARGIEERRGSTWAVSFVSACAAAALVLVVIRLTAPGPSAGGGPSELVAEAVNDHIRVISSTHPVDIESGGMHQVKPWFTGRLDFAPRVTFSGDDDFPLVGGSVGYFRDRKAAVFVFKRRLHTITLLVFPPEGLAWPNDDLARVGRLSVSEANARGFSVLMWRDGGLGYALVSDVNVHDLEALAPKINGGD